MFIKKDTRKIPQILTDAVSRLSPESDETPITELSFARRAPEFSNGISLILQPSHHPALGNLMQLSLYDCGLKSMNDISQSDDSVLFPKLKQLDIGRNNELVNDSLSDSFHTQFPSLEEIWVDDCSFGPTIPDTLLKLNKLEIVRMTGNSLQSVKNLNQYWPMVRVLALDGNKLESASGLGDLQYLEKLHLRENKLKELEGVPCATNEKLTMISLSSNQLSKLPDSFASASSLKEVYLNSNRIEVLPNGLGKLRYLIKLNLAHNNIGHAEDEELSLPSDFVERFGVPEVISCNCEKDNTCTVLLEGNPLTDRRKKKHLEEEKRKSKEIAMDIDDGSN